jgi:O-antigen/teichoic acid export membrane protein
MNLSKLKSLFDAQTKVLFKNSSWVLGGNLTRSALVFLRGIIIARGLGVELYGTFTIIAAFAGSIQQFLNFTLSSTIIKFGASYLSNKKNDKLTALIKSGYYFSSIVAVLSTSIIAFLTIFVYDVFLDKPGLQWFILMYAIISSTMFIDNISTTLLQLYYKFKQAAIINIVVTIIDLLIIAIIVLFNPNNFTYFFIALVSSRLLGSVILNIATFTIVKNSLLPYLKTSVRVLKDDYKVLVNYTVANSGSRAIKSLINNGDVLLLGAMLGPVPVAFYNIAKKLAYMILIFIDPLTNTIFPQLSLLIADQKYDEVKKMIYRITKLLVIPSIVFVAIVYFFRDYIIILTYGKEYLEAAKPFLFLTINAVVGAILFWNLPLLLSLGMAKFRFYVNVVSLVLGGLVAYLLIPTYSTNGAAIGLLVANSFVIGVFCYVSITKINSATHKKVND